MTYSTRIDQSQSRTFLFVVCEGSGDISSVTKYHIVVAALDLPSTLSVFYNTNNRCQIDLYMHFVCTYEIQLRAYFR